MFVCIPPGKAVPEMIHTVLGGTLNFTQSLTLMYNDELIVSSKLGEDHGVNVNVCRNKERKRKCNNICFLQA